MKPLVPSLLIAALSAAISGAALAADTGTWSAALRYRYEGVDDDAFARAVEVRQREHDVLERVGGGVLPLQHGVRVRDERLDRRRVRRVENDRGSGRVEPAPAPRW